MASELLRISDYVAAKAVLNGQSVVIITYRIGDRFACKVENSDVGLSIATVFRNSKTEAYEAGVSLAESLLEQNATTFLIQQRHVVRPWQRL